MAAGTINFEKLRIRRRGRQTGPPQGTPDRRASLGMRLRETGDCYETGFNHVVVHPSGAFAAYPAGFSAGRTSSSFRPRRGRRRTESQIEMLEPEVTDRAGTGATQHLFLAGHLVEGDRRLCA